MNRSQNSDKDYNIFLHQHNNNNSYSVIAKHGKTGKANREVIICSHVSKALAYISFDEMMSAKLKKGYNIINKNIGLWQEKARQYKEIINTRCLNKEISKNEYDRLIMFLNSEDPETQSMVEKLINLPNNTAA
jgi:hypothetical protein